MESLINQNKKTWTTNNQVMYSLFLSHCTPGIETKLQGMETCDTIDTKQDGLGMISLIRDVTHRRDETEHVMLDIARADKELIICCQKYQILIT